MKGDKEFVGTLRGFDDYVNMVLEDVTEFEVRWTSNSKIQRSILVCVSLSEMHCAFFLSELIKHM